MVTEGRIIPKFLPLPVDVKDFFGRADKHENADGRGHKERRGERDAETTPHSRSHPRLQGLYRRLLRQIASHCLKIDRDEIDGSPTREE